MRKKPSHFALTRNSDNERRLRTRPLPEWFDHAKFGIFVHWGLFSIPAFAPKFGKISEVFKSHYDRAVTLTPYTEWYANAIKVPDSPSAEFHRTHFPGLSYASFREPFLEGLRQWNPQDWARLFKAAGARYVVLVTKHHDGFCLWPSGIHNSHRQHWLSQRDIVGELAEAVRAQGLRFGLYYSGGIDWTFNSRPLKTFGEFISSTPGDDYPLYAQAQIRELIDRYAPDVLWNDISWPDDLKSLERLLAYYYEKVPQGVVNDRWQHQTLFSRALKIPLLRWGFDRIVERHIRRHPEIVDGVIPQPVPYSDFRTPEYAAFADLQQKKWEATRGMSHSFGFNRNDTDEDYESAASLLSCLIDAVSKNGNLLLNVGPRGEDASIPCEQRSRLLEIGKWLKENGEAIYDTRPCSLTSAETDEGIAVRFTRKEERFFLIILGRPGKIRIQVSDFPEEMGRTIRARHLVGGHPVQADIKSGRLELALQLEHAKEHANVVVLTRAGNEPA